MESDQSSIGESLAVSAVFLTDNQFNIYELIISHKRVVKDGFFYYSDFISKNMIQKRWHMKVKGGATEGKFFSTLKVLKAKGIVIKDTKTKAKYWVNKDIVVINKDQAEVVSKPNQKIDNQPQPAKPISKLITLSQQSSLEIVEHTEGSPQLITLKYQYLANGQPRVLIISIRSDNNVAQ